MISGSSAWRSTAIVTLAATMVVLSAGAAPLASALPPSVDPALLPPESEPGPLEPTKQGKDCAITVPAADSSTIPAAMTMMNFAAAWPLTRGGGQTVAVIDTGVSRNPRLFDPLPGGDYVSGSDGLSDCDAHGTAVAGLIAGLPRPGSGFSGGAPDARILSIRQSSNAFELETRVDQEPAPEAANSSGYGNVLTMAQAVRRAADMGATVINISEVACGNALAGLGDGPLGAAVRYAAVERNVVIVAAAGNVESGPCQAQNPMPDPAHPYDDPWTRVLTAASPAWFDDYVLTVGSVEADASPSTYSLAGPWVDVAAPGSDAISLNAFGDGLISGTVGNNGQTVPLTGTSFAAPLVSATASLVRSRFPQLSAAQVIDRIERTAHAPADGWNPMVGHGTVDPVAAVTTEPSAPVNDSGVATSASASLPDRIEAAAPDTRPRRAALIGIGLVAVTLIAVAGLSSLLRRR